MYMCMRKYMCIYIQVYTYAYVFVCVCICICIYVYVYGHSGQLSIATSNNHSVVNTICIISFRYTHVITSRKFQFK